VARAISQSFVSEDVAETFVALSQGRGTHIELFREIIRDEIQRTLDYATLFRTDSTATKMMRQFSVLLGHNWLKELILSFIHETLKNPTKYELNELKIGPGESIEENLRNIEGICRGLLDHLLAHADTCPNDIRKICSILKQEVEAKFEQSNVALAGFIFLRFLCPAIIAPDKLVGESTQVSGEARKFLTTVGKVVQNIANGVLFSKEMYMIPLNNLVEEYIPRVEEYLQNFATIPESRNPVAGIEIPQQAISDFIEKMAHEIAPHRARVYEEAEKIVQTESLQFVNDELSSLFHIVDVLEAEEKQEGYQSKPKRSLASFFH